jgi:GNAT superfamily N-acetyltransferase
VAEIRTYEPDDAEGAVSLLARLVPTTVHTPESLRWRERAQPGRASWVAVEDGDVIGFATSFPQLWTGERGTSRVWAGVREDRRRQGIGSVLWAEALDHMREARRHTTEVDGDESGLEFVEHRGFTEFDSEVMSSLDPTDRTLEPELQDDFPVVELGDLGERDADLFDFYGAAGGIPPGAPITLEYFRSFVLGNPTLDRSTSVVVLGEGGRIVSLSWLLVDRERARAENEWTATLPELRGRGLARLAKLESIRRAAEAGIREILTGNDPNNTPMRALNRSLGYRELYIRRDLELRIES